MKTISFILVVICFAGAPMVAAQMYDPNYNGPVNAYGQPSYSVSPQNSSQPAQQPPSGLIPYAGSALQKAGGYLWGFLPAPVRGAQPAYAVPPGAGQTNVIFVPGSR